MEKGELLLSILSTILGSSVLNGIITHILYNTKLKKELKNKGNDMIAQDIANSLKFFRNLELELTTQEIYNIEDELNERGSHVNFFEGECIYPAIFNDWASYNSFMEKIHTCREQHEKNFSCKIALNLVFIDRYTQQLSLFMKENGNEATLPFWGTIFIFDLQRWQKKIDKLLVNEINKYSYKLESHCSNKWKRLRRKELIKQYESTILHFLLTDICPLRYKKKMTALKTLLESTSEKY